MSNIRYRSNPTPKKCAWGRQMRDELSGQKSYEYFLTPDADGRLVDSRKRGTLDERPDLDGRSDGGR